MSKIKCRVKSCCIGFSLADGVHGIVVWDCLYALFIVTTTMSILVKQVETNRTSESITDIVTAGLVTIRAGVGMSSCLHNFQLSRVRTYLIIRFFWDVGLVIFKLIMAGLRTLGPVTFFSQMAVLVLLDGYLNFIIYSYLSFILYPLDEDLSFEENEDEEQAASREVVPQVDINGRVLDPEAPDGTGLTLNYANRCFGINGIAAVNKCYRVDNDEVKPEDIEVAAYPDKQQTKPQQQLPPNTVVNINLNLNIMMNPSQMSPPEQPRQDCCDSSPEMFMLGGTNNNGFQLRKSAAVQDRMYQEMLPNTDGSPINMMAAQRRLLPDQIVSGEQLSYVGGLRIKQDEGAHDQYFVHYGQQKQQMKKVVRKGRRSNLQTQFTIVGGGLCRPNEEIAPPQNNLPIEESKHLVDDQQSLPYHQQVSATIDHFIQTATQHITRTFNAASNNSGSCNKSESQGHQELNSMESPREEDDSLSRQGEPSGQNYRCCEQQQTFTEEKIMGGVTDVNLNRKQSSSCNMSSHPSQ